MKILLLGANGQIGRELKITLSTIGNVIPVISDQLDLTDINSIAPFLEEIKPDLVVNAAAYTNVDQAERYRNIANKVNHLAVSELGKLAAKLGFDLIHFSTDYVFNGETDQPYTENGIPDPINKYGETKLAGEQALADNYGTWARTTIFRTSWIYGDNDRNNFLNTMKRLFRQNEGKEIKIVNDQIGCPTWSRLVAEAVSQYVTNRSWCYNFNISIGRSIGPHGIFNLCCGGSCSWFDFAKEILFYENRDVKLVPISTAEFPTEAKRPKHSVLDCTKLKTKCGINLPHWKYGLRLLYK